MCGACTWLLIKGWFAQVLSVWVSFLDSCYHCGQSLIDLHVGWSICLSVSSQVKHLNWVSLGQLCQIAIQPQYFGGRSHEGNFIQRCSETYCLVHFESSQVYWWFVCSSVCVPCGMSVCLLVISNQLHWFHVCISKLAFWKPIPHTSAFSVKCYGPTIRVSDI